MGQHAPAARGAFDVVEGVAAVELEVVRADGVLAPQGAADQGVDAVRADEDVGFVDLSAGQVQAHRAGVLLDPLDGPVGLQDAGGQGGQEAFVQVGAEQADEAAAEVADDVAGQLDADAGLAAQVAELALAGCAEVGDVDAEQAEGFDGGWPQVEDVAGRAGLRVPFEEGDVVAGLVYGQGGGHSGRPGADDGYPARSAGRRRDHVRLVMGEGCVQGA